MEFAISIRRSHRDTAPEDWIDLLREAEGVTLLGEPLFGRVMVEAAQDGAQRLQELLGEAFIVEPVILYDTSRKGDLGSDTPP